ncbi:outer membrane beta-barrel protein [Marinobacter sp.]|uniref:outer membrane beta-barrel protein n=1 Tax=Marinobacter sp. TaxID=50741 RepID=UPI003567A760
MASQQGAGMLRTATQLMFTLAVAGTTASNVAAQTEITGGIDSRYTDNARKSDSGEVSDLESRVYIKADYTSDPGRCNANLRGTVGYSYWLDDSFDDETYGEMDFIGDCELADQLYWDAANTLREVNESSRAGDTPDNRTRKNVFSTGPRYNWRINNANWLTLSTRYENTEFSDIEDSDTERYTGTASWNHLFSQTLNGGLSATYSRTDYDSGSEVDVKTGRVTFSKRWATTDVSGSVGISEIETRFGATTQSSDGLVGELAISRALTQSSDWYFRAAHELTDRTSNLDFRYGDFQFNLQDSISVETSTVSTGFNQRFSNSSTLNVDLYGSQSDYLDSPEREDGGGVRLRYSRPVAQRTNAYLGLGYDYQTYASDNVDDRTSSVELGAEYQASRELNLQARMGHENRVSDQASSEYNENWVLLGVEYQFR